VSRSAEMSNRLVVTYGSSVARIRGRTTKNPSPAVRGDGSWIPAYSTRASRPTP